MLPCSSVHSCSSSCSRFRSESWQMLAPVQDTQGVDWDNKTVQNIHQKHSMQAVRTTSSAEWLRSSQFLACNVHTDMSNLLEWNACKRRHDSAYSRQADDSPWLCAGAFEAELISCRDFLVFNKLLVTAAWELSACMSLLASSNRAWSSWLALPSSRK
jgi:hypothetical protein